MTAQLKSLTEIENNSSSRIKLWGTPQWIGSKLELKLFILTYCDRLGNKKKNQLLASLLMPYPVDTGRKLNLHKTFRRRPGRLMYVQFTSCVYWVVNQFLYKEFLYNFCIDLLCQKLFWDQKIFHKHNFYYLFTLF